MPYNPANDRFNLGIRHIISVVSPEFGAAGNGIHDDTAAIQAALDVAFPGDIVQLAATNAGPSNATRFMQSAPLVIPDGVCLVGPMAPPGTKSVTLHVADNSNLEAQLIPKSYLANVTSVASPFRVDHISFYGNKDNQGGQTATGHGVMVMNYNTSIDHCNFSNTYGAGVVLTDTNKAGTVISGTMSDVRIESCGTFHTGSYGIWVKDTSGSGCCVDGLIADCKVQYAQDHGIWIARGAGWTVRDTHISASWNDALRVDNSFATRIHDLYVDGFGANPSTITAVGVNLNSIIAGRPSKLSDITVFSSEASFPNNIHIYYRLRNQTTAISTTTEISGCLANRSDISAANSVALSTVANGGTLTVIETGNDWGDMPTTLNLGAGDVVNRYDTSGRKIGVMESMKMDTIDPDTLSPSLSTGTLLLTYFDADQTLTVTKLRTFTRNTAAAGGVTLARMGLYLVDTNTGNLTCIARTASDAAMWSVIRVLNERAIADNGAGSPGAISSIMLRQGWRYAAAVLQVGGSTGPTLAGKTLAPTMSSVTGPATRRSGYLQTQTDMPATILGTTINGLTAATLPIYMQLQ